MTQRFFCYQLAAGILLAVGLWGSSDLSAQNVYVQPLDNIELSVQPRMRTPESKSVSLHPNARVEPNGALLMWEAPNDTYKNLLFEDPLLERHGVSPHGRLQPAISGLKFYTQSALYPLTFLRRQNKRQDNPLGWGAPQL